MSKYPSLDSCSRTRLFKLVDRDNLASPSGLVLGEFSVESELSQQRYAELLEALRDASGNPSLHVILMSRSDMSGFILDGRVFIKGLNHMWPRLVEDVRTIYTSGTDSFRRDRVYAIPEGGTIRDLPVWAYSMGRVAGLFDELDPEQEFRLATHWDRQKYPEPEPDVPFWDIFEQAGISHMTSVYVENFDEYLRNEYRASHAILVRTDRETPVVPVPPVGGYIKGGIDLWIAQTQVWPRRNRCVYDSSCYRAIGHQDWIREPPSICSQIAAIEPEYYAQVADHLAQIDQYNPYFTTDVVSSAFPHPIPFSKEAPKDLALHGPIFYDDGSHYQTDWSSIRPVDINLNGPSNISGLIFEDPNDLRTLSPRESLELQVRVLCGCDMTEFYKKYPSLVIDRDSAPTMPHVSEYRPDTVEYFWNPFGTWPEGSYRFGHDS